MPNFQSYDPSITFDDVLQLGQQIASRPDNLIGNPGDREFFEQDVNLGGQQIRVRVVLNSLGRLRSVHIRDR